MADCPGCSGRWNARFEEPCRSCSSSSNYSPEILIEPGFVCAGCGKELPAEEMSGVDHGYCFDCSRERQIKLNTEAYEREKAKTRRRDGGKRR